MVNIISPDGNQLLKRCVLAFDKFSFYRYPVNLRSWVYTSKHDSLFHNHDFPQLWYCADGRYLHQVGNQVYECSKGSVVVIPTGVFHKFSVPEDEETRLLCLEVMFDTFLDVSFKKYLNAIAAFFLPPFSRELGYKYSTYQILSRESQKAFEEYCSWLSLLSFARSVPVDNKDILMKLEELFSLPEFALPDVYREKAMQLVASNLNPVLKVLRYLNDHYHEKLVEQMLLSTIGISHASFYRYFKCYTGYTFAQYLQLLRVMHVHLYLSRTSYPISYISDMCGFCNTQYMSRIYKKYSGRSPREARMCLSEFYKNSDRTNFV